MVLRKNYLISSLLSNNILQYGDFTLKSGKKSDYYIDMRDVYSIPELRSMIISSLLYEITNNYNYKDIDAIVGVPYAGCMWATLLADSSDKPYFFVRKDVKSHGKKKKIEGGLDMNKTYNVLLVEDVITTGKSICELIDELKDFPLNIKGIVNIINRVEEESEYFNKLQKNYNVISMINYQDIQKFKSIDYKEITLDEKLSIKDKLRKPIIFSADIRNPTEFFNKIEFIAPYISGIKTHVDIMFEWSDYHIEKLIEIKKKYNLIVIEDKKWCDIGHIVKYQMNSPIYKYKEWVDVMTVHCVAGESTLKSLVEWTEENNSNIKFLLVAEMSTQNNFIDKNYTTNVLELAKKYKDNVLGFICQNRFYEYDTECNDFLAFSPGAHFQKQGDNLLQTYETPEDKIKKGINYIIMGRSLINSDNPIELLENMK